MKRVMNLKQNLVIKNFFESFKAIKSKKYYILYPVIVDLLFILSYGSVLGFFIGNIQEKAVALIETGKSILYSGGLIKGLLTNNQVISIVLSTLGFMITTYIQYCIFQGVTWRFARKFVEEHVHFFSYLKKFFLVNIFWFFWFFIVEILDYVRRLLVYLRGEELTTTLFSGLLLFFIFVIIYFAFISYALINRYKIVEAVKKSFSLGIKKINFFLLMHLIIFLVFLIINLLLILTFKVNLILMVIVGIVLVSPAYTWARVFLSLIVNELDKK